MKPQLVRLIDDTAKKIVDGNAKCLFTDSEIKQTKAALILFASEIVAEVSQPEQPGT